MNPIYPPEPCGCGAEDCPECFPEPPRDPYAEDPNFLIEEYHDELSPKD